MVGCQSPSCIVGGSISGEETWPVAELLGRENENERERERERERSSRKTHKQHKPRKTDEVTGAHSFGKITEHVQKENEPRVPRLC